MALFLRHPDPQAPTCGFEACQQTLGLSVIETAEGRTYFLCGAHLPELRRKGDYVRVLLDGPDDPGRD